MNRFGIPSRRAFRLWTLFAALVVTGVVLVPLGLSLATGWDEPDGGEAWRRTFRGPATQAEHEWVVRVPQGHNPYLAFPDVRLPFRVAGDADDAGGLVLQGVLLVNGHEAQNLSFAYHTSGAIVSGRDFFEDDDYDMPFLQAGENEIRIRLTATWTTPREPGAVTLAIGPPRVTVRAPDQDWDAIPDRLQLVPGVNSLLLSGLLIAGGWWGARRYGGRAEGARETEAAEG